MMTKIDMSEMRATIFAPPIFYNTENLKKLLSVLPEEDSFTPRIFDTIPGTSIQFQFETSFIEWEMFSNKKNVRIHFSPQKIDIFQSFNHIIETGNTTEKGFCLYSCDLFKTIIKTFSITPTRLAFAPIYYQKKSNDNAFGEFYSSIFKKCTYDNISMNSCSFRQAFRLNKKIGERSIDYNYVIDVLNELRAEIKDNKQTLYPVLSFKLDINTVQESSYKFNNEELDLFFGLVTDYAKSFLENYLSLQ